MESFGFDISLEITAIYLNIFLYYYNFIKYSCKMYTPIHNAFVTLMSIKIFVQVSRIFTYMVYVGQKEVKFCVYKTLCAPSS